jgi:ribonuclease HII
MASPPPVSESLRGRARRAGGARKRSAVGRLSRQERKAPRAGLAAATGWPWRPHGRNPGYTPRTSSGLAAYERVLDRAGFGPVAGIDEAGRGACAGPLVVAAVVLRPGGRVAVPGLADSKELTPLAREEVYRHLVRAAFDWHVVVIPSTDIDRLGLHVCNVAGMRRAMAGLACKPGFVLTDGFPVRGLGTPSLAMWKGDQVAGCVAAASILAKVTRDRIMTDLDERHPQYGFAQHKGYCTTDHRDALMAHGPCVSHRFSYVNVIEAARAHGLARVLPAQLVPAQEGPAEVAGLPGSDDAAVLSTDALHVG